MQDDINIQNWDFRPLNSRYLSLKKYNPIKVHGYDTKEICIII